MDEYVPAPADTAPVASVFAEVEETGRFRRCVACGVQPTYTNLVAQAGPYTEYDNVLILDLAGGYGMFFDNIEGNYTVVLCHDCAHEACEALPWLAALIEPARSHSHTEAYVRANPDHHGWDYDAAWTHTSQVAADAREEQATDKLTHGKRSVL